ncbi:MAG: hypothetical protein IJB31_01425 [Akkermansia sp.]|nr:hypothetical protein [Akkermansia sp.]
MREIGIFLTLIFTLCVDLPITCVENGIVISVFALLLAAGLQSASSSSGSSSGSYSGGSSYEEDYNRMQRENYEFNARVTAGGPPI